MPMVSPRRAPRFAVLALAALAGLAGIAGLTSPVWAAATVGFVEKFPGTSIAGWDGGAIESNPGTGGLFGAGDGFLQIKTPNGFQHNLGVKATGAAWTGDWWSAGIQQVRLWLKDVGSDDPLEIHFSVGQQFNLWQYDPAFLPPEDRWAEFVVDVSSDANFTPIVGAGSFEDALMGVEVVHVRHDRAPFVQTPDALDGDVGIDQILLTDGLVGVGSRAPVARPLALAPPSPNPSRGPVVLTLEASEAGPIKIEIVDASGRMVRRHEDTAGAPGPRTWMWDGRDSAGHIVAPGVYRVRATGPSGGMSRSLVRID